MRRFFKNPLFLDCGYTSSLCTAMTTQVSVKTPKNNAPTISTYYVSKRFEPVLAASKIFLESLKRPDFLQTYANNLKVSVALIEKEIYSRTIEIKTISVEDYNSDMVDDAHRWAKEDAMMAGWVDTVPHRQENKLFLNEMVC